MIWLLKSGGWEMRECIELRQITCLQIVPRRWVFLLGLWFPPVPLTGICQLSVQCWWNILKRVVNPRSNTWKKKIIILTEVGHIRETFLWFTALFGELWCSFWRKFTRVSRGKDKWAQSPMAPKSWTRPPRKCPFT